MVNLYFVVTILALSLVLVEEQAFSLQIKVKINKPPFVNFLNAPNRDKQLYFKILKARVLSFETPIDREGFTITDDIYTRDLTS